MLDCYTVYERSASVTLASLPGFRFTLQPLPSPTSLDRCLERNIEKYNPDSEEPKGSTT